MGTESWLSPRRTTVQMRWNPHDVRSRFRMREMDRAPFWGVKCIYEKGSSRGPFCTCAIPYSPALSVTPSILEFFPISHFGPGR